jgi:hypothetical protein
MIERKNSYAEKDEQKLRTWKKREKKRISGGSRPIGYRIVSYRIIFCFVLRGIVLHRGIVILEVCLYIDYRLSVCCSDGGEDWELREIGKRRVREGSIWYICMYI